MTSVHVLVFMFPKIRCAATGKGLAQALVLTADSRLASRRSLKAQPDKKRAFRGT